MRSDLPPLTYLSFDGLASGVGASQVLPYVERLAARGVQVTVHSFEQDGDRADVARRLTVAGADWVPHEFGRPGAAGGVGRIARAAVAVRGAPLVHARSDLAAAAAMVGAARSWVWDVRSLWREQRLELGALRAGSPEERALRLVERRAARRASGMVTLTEAVVPVLAARHGRLPLARAVVPTCVALDRFPSSPLPPTDELRLLFSGSLNRYYDLPAMVAFTAAVRALLPTTLAVLAPGATAWERELTAAGAERASATPGQVPDHLRRSHAGLSICRGDLGPSLLAAMPTKLGEFLASGRPVVVSTGLGDMDTLLADHRCGVSLASAAPADQRAAARDLVELLEDPALPDRCRGVAERHFDVDQGAAALIDLYERVTR